MNAKEKVIIMARVEEARLNCNRYEGTEWEKVAFEVYTELYSLAHDLRLAP